ncbi:putative F-box/FBD/LRR-repeat protein At4g03220 [Rosa rugosa]|uniref:putative F-box/FBD/LRR-repeat protein At4g03220 n=1 Tax=Rosa rugosa TaxID=74645 RepID=UPI002B40C8E9|nr:putative F-box/FBD/LRR-repeat protein At4g03220 [Rosa rugosa]
MGNIFATCFTCKQKSGSSADRISDLPDDILHVILSFLPFKSVGQTAILSRRWNDVWSSYPIIDFYEIFTGSEADHHQTKTRIINTILARHEENYNILYPCRKISLPRVGGDPNKSCLSRVEELVLDIRLSSGNTSDLHQCQLMCHSLRSSSCGNSKAWLGFPSSYVVGSYLRSLHTLSLTRVDFLDSSALGVDLFSGSSFPYLEKLNLERCRGRSDLKICCPNLKHIRVFDMELNSLDISGMRLEELRVWFCFQECINGSWINIFAPNLQSFFWRYSGITERCSIQSFPMLKRSFISSPLTTKKINNNSVVDVLSASSQVEDFEISHDYLQILSEIYFEFGGLPFSFMKLKTLRIWSPIKQRYIPGMACLFKSSPVVHTLEIYFYSYEENGKWNNQSLDDANCTQEQYWETQGQYLSPSLSHLKVVRISLGEMIPESAIKFAKFVLKYGRHLQKMSVSFHMSKSCLPPNSLSDTIALIKSFRRASAYVKFSTLCY